MGNPNNRPYDQDADNNPRKKITISTLPNKEDNTKRASVKNPTPGTADKAKNLKAVPSNAAKQRAKLNQTPEDKRASNALKNIQKKGK
jgi:hypothetical protein